MVTAVQAAVVAAAAAWVIGVGVAVYLMLKAARLVSQTSATVAGLRKRGDLLIDRANAAIDRAGEQIAKTEAVTASIEGVTATMSELDGHLTALAPPAASQASATGRPLTCAGAGGQRSADLGGGGRSALGPSADLPRIALIRSERSAYLASAPWRDGS